MKSDLPKIPYYTLADVYIVSCFVFVLLIALDVVVMVNVDHDDADKLEEADMIGLVLIICLFAIWHVVYVVVVWKAKQREMEKLEWYHKDYCPDDGDEDDEEEDTSVSHLDCHLDKDVTQRLGKHWDEYVKKSNDEDESDQDNDNEQKQDDDENIVYEEKRGDDNGGVEVIDALQSATKTQTEMSESTAL